MSDSDNEIYFSTKYAEARVLFPLLSWPSYTHVAAGAVTTESLNVAGLPVFNIPPGFDMQAQDEANDTVDHEAGHAFIRRLEFTTGVPRAIYTEQFRVKFGYPTDYVVTGYSAGRVSLEEAWAEAFANACAGRIVTSKSYLDEQVDPLAARAWFQTLAGMTTTVVVPTTTVVPPVGMVDLTGELPRADWSIGFFSPKTSVTVHWNGAAVPDDVADIDVIFGDASYHISKDWSPAPGIQGGDGIMYHRLYGRDGTVYKTREDDAVLWHCGADGNTTSFAWQVICGEGQLPTPAQLTSLRRDLTAIGLSALGHRDWSATACPGDALYAFVHEEEDMDRATFNSWFAEQYLATIDPTIRAMKAAYDPAAAQAHPKTHKHSVNIAQVIDTGDPK